eukprot:COSAG06_NODE_47012_length_342_cov_1.148148_1_plen_65_part_10
MNRDRDRDRMDRDRNEPLLLSLQMENGLNKSDDSPSRKKNTEKEARRRRFCFPQIPRTKHIGIIY